MTDRDRMAGGDGTGEERIVVGFDGSASAWQALRWAADEAGSRRDPLEIVSCVAADTTTEPSAVRRAVEAHLAAEAERVAANRGWRIPVHTTVAAGSPGEVLVDMCHDAGMLVLGRHDPAAATIEDGSSLSSYCDAHAPCPVTVVASTSDPGCHPLNAKAAHPR